MSTIAWRDGIMAADTRAYGGRGEPTPGRKVKIHRLEDGSLIGLSTSALGMSERFVAWLRDGAKPDVLNDKIELRGLMVKPDGGVFVLDNTPFFSGPISCDFYAVGSGAGYAMGAMAMGATAEQAVSVSCDLDPHTGAPVMAERL